MILRTDEAARFLGMQATTLQAWRCRGEGPRFVKLGKSVRYREQDLEEYIEAQTRRNTSENSDEG